MQQLKEAKIQGNRIEVGEWFIYIKPLDELDLRFRVYHKEKGDAWDFETLEDAMERIK